MIPNDTLKPNKTSGLRIGFAAVTTRGCTLEQAKEIAHIINDYLKGNIDKEEGLLKVDNIVKSWKNINAL